MDFKVIVNVLLIILALHLLIKNIPYKKSIINTFFNRRAKREENDSLRFLMDRKIEYFDNDTDTDTETEVKTPAASPEYNKLVDYVHKCELSSIKPGNYYATDENSANFTSNVLNVHKFYDRDNGDAIGEYDGQTDLVPSKYIEPPLSKEKETTTIDSISQQSCFTDRNTHDNTEIFKPDNWQYNNELPMNGGNFMGNLTGYDNLESAYPVYGDQSNYLKSSAPDNRDCEKKPDDLRMGLGDPNKEYRTTR